MDERQLLAIAALAEGKSIEDAAKEVGRTPRTILKWLDDPEFQALVLRGIRSQALLVLARCVRGEGDPKEAQVALGILRWTGAGKVPKEKTATRETEPDTDLDEFSEDQLRRVTGDE